MYKGDALFMDINRTRNFYLMQRKTVMAMSCGPGPTQLSQKN